MSSLKDIAVAPEEMERLLSVLKDQLQKRYSGKTILRAFHPKMHGLVKGYFEIPSDLPSEYISPLFVPGKKYQTLIRFSNGNRKISSDAKKDLRGIAIKIIGVPGAKVLENEKGATTQDLLLANYPIFPPGTFHGTVKGIVATSGNIIQKIIFAVTHLRVVINAIRSATVSRDLLNTTYFSQVPYRFNNETFVKYILKPRDASRPIPAADSKDGFLKERLIKSLSAGDVIFDLFIQKRQEGDLLNDASVEWKGPAVKVASLRIIQQEFDTTRQNEFGEKLSFTPWHSLPEHIPAGDIGIARKEIYNIMSRFRGAFINEPSSFDI